MNDLQPEQTKKLALAHASRELSVKGEGYTVLSNSTGSDVFGSVNQDGAQVGKRASSKQVTASKSKRRRAV